MFEGVHPGTDGHAIPLDAKYGGSCAMDDWFNQNVTDHYRPYTLISTDLPPERTALE
jgi:hypothetical protein